MNQSCAGNVVFIRVGNSYHSASFNRIQTIKKCLINNNFKVITLSIRLFENNTPKDAVWVNKFEFLYDDTIFRNIMLPEKNANSLIKKALIALQGLYAAKKYLQATTVRNRILFLFSTSIIDYLFFFFIARKNNYKMVTDRSEYPHYIRKKNVLNHIYRFCFDKCKFKFFDGMTVISYTLYDFYRKRVRKNTSIYVLPMTIDLKRFESVERYGGEQYIGYAGGLRINKDGVHYLIHSFNKIHLKYPSIELRIAGDLSIKAEIDYLKKISNEKVKFLGSLPREYIPPFLVNAKILVLARPSSKQADGGFPTKLGEYLASEVPVIVTDVGEITKYLVHKKNAYIIKPDDIDELIFAFDEILSNYNYYREMGKAGRETVKKFFDYRRYAETFADYLLFVKRS